MSETLTRKLEISPAYDKRPKYGQHCVDMRWLVQGRHGSVQFLLFTGWYPAIIPTPDKRWQELTGVIRLGPHDAPMAADLGYHSRVPRYEDQMLMDKECPYLEPPGPCYYDGSGLNARRIFSILVHKGGEAVWEALEEYYRKTFEREIQAEAEQGELK